VLFVDGLAMATTICNFGWIARDFALEGVDHKTYRLADVRGPKGTLVTFICNHCPYVKAVIDRLVEEAKVLREIGIGTIAIMPNDTKSYPEDSFANMKVFAARHALPFPPRCLAHHPGAGRAPRALRGHETGGGDRARPAGAGAEHGLLHQMAVRERHAAPRHPIIGQRALPHVIWRRSAGAVEGRGSQQ
jgi:hypothetical protein